MKFRITHEWAHRLGMLLADFSHLEFELKRGEAYLNGMTWAQAMNSDVRRRTLGQSWKQFKDAVSKALGGTPSPDFQRLVALMDTGDDDDGLARVRNSVAHGMWVGGNGNHTMVMNLTLPAKGEWKGRAAKLRDENFDALRADIDKAIKLTRALTESACAASGIDTNALALA